MLLPVDSQESFVPMGEHGYRIAIGAGSSPHNLRGSASSVRTSGLPPGLYRRRA